MTDAPKKFGDATLSAVVTEVVRNRHDIDRHTEEIAVLGAMLPGRGVERWILSAGLVLGVYAAALLTILVLR
jgi:hypothetical protein